MLNSFGTDKVPTCSGSTTAANLSGGGDDGYFFRTAPATTSGPALAALITGDKHERWRSLPATTTTAKGFSSPCPRRSGSSGAQVTETVLYNPDASNFGTDVQKTLDSSPDAVVILGFQRRRRQVVSTLIGKGAGPSQMPLYTADGMKGSSFGKTVDPSDPSKVEGIPAPLRRPLPRGREPVHRWFAKTGIDTIFSSYYWDCTNLMARLRRSGPRRQR